MTTAARTAPVSIAHAPTKSAPIARSAPEETHVGAYLVTAMIATFFATVAIVYWMAHTLHV